MLGGRDHDGSVGGAFSSSTCPSASPPSAITLWQVDESKTPHAARPDWAGFAILTAGLVSLVYGLIRAGEIAWSDTGCSSAWPWPWCSSAAFVVVERRADHPMFDLSLFRIPTFGGGLVAAFAMNGSLFAMLLYLVLYLQDDLGYSALGTGVRLLVISGGTLVRPRWPAG